MSKYESVVMEIQGKQKLGKNQKTATGEYCALSNLIIQRYDQRRRVLDVEGTHKLVFGEKFTNPLKKAGVLIDLRDLPKNIAFPVIPFLLKIIALARNLDKEKRQKISKAIKSVAAPLGIDFCQLSETIIPKEDNDRLTLDINGQEFLVRKSDFMNMFKKAGVPLKLQLNGYFCLSQYCLLHQLSDSDLSKQILAVADLIASKLKIV